MNIDLEMALTIAAGVVLGRFIGWLLIKLRDYLLTFFRETRRKFKK
jgi:hypothetical protein